MTALEGVLAVGGLEGALVVDGPGLLPPALPLFCARLAGGLALRWIANCAILGLILQSL